jgi:hypothetical protein
MTATASAAAATTPAAKIDIAPIGLAPNIGSAAAFAGSGNHRKQATDARAMALLADNASIGILVTRQQLKTRVTIMAEVLIERHRELTYLSLLHWTERNYSPVRVASH